MKRILTLSIVISAAALMNGCTKCSHEAPVAPPPAVEPGPNSVPSSDMPIEGAPTDETPSAPTDVTAPENK